MTPGRASRTSPCAARRLATSAVHRPTPPTPPGHPWGTTLEATGTPTHVLGEWRERARGRSLTAPVCQGQTLGGVGSGTQGRSRQTLDGAAGGLALVYRSLGLRL